MGIETAGRVVSRFFLRGERPEPSARREQPERVVLGVPDGVVPSAKPPVRIFLGTQRGQERAERVFVWSILQAGDPSRVYEIFLMKDLASFDQRRWTTGFTNYRFAIPHFVQGTGRAIYNDVDQIYLCDPAELFDAQMNGYGFLAISETESSVMLIDCAMMAKIWTLEDARRLPKKQLLARAVAVPGLCGPLAPEWNARDEEYVQGRSKLLHYTTLHTQPRRPFPEQFVYQEHPCAEPWLALERGADAAGAQVFTRQQPSQQYARRLSAYRRMREEAPPSTATHEAATGGDAGACLPPHDEAVASLVELSRARSVLVYGDAIGAMHNAPRDLRTKSLGREGHRWGEVAVDVYDPVSQSFSESPEARFDGVVCLHVLDCTPEEDIPWVLDELFRYARRFVYVAVSCDPKRGHLPGGEPAHCTEKRPGWWEARMGEAAARFPEVHWRLATEKRSRLRGTRVSYRSGGRYLGHEAPRVWVLADDRPGNRTQAVGLAEALGWPYTAKELKFNLFSGFSNRILGATLIGLNRARSTALGPPWPDLVIGAGRRVAPVARWIGKQSRGHSRLVQLGRKGGQVAAFFNLVVTPAYGRLLPHQRRLTTIGPLNRVTPERLAQARERWPNLFGHAPSPHIVLLVGGRTRRHRLDPDAAFRMGQEVRAFARDVGGTLHAVTSRRTGAEATEALSRGLGGSSQVHRWQPGPQESPYLAYLASADLIVVTGESESMLMESAATGKPVYIYDLPERRPSVAGRLKEWVVARAQVRPANNRGTVRPQQGLEYLCARLIERGIIRPSRDLRALHQTLISLGIARPFGAPLETGSRPPLRETNSVARRVRMLVGVPDLGGAPALTPDAEAAMIKASTPDADLCALNDRFAAPSSQRHTQERTFETAEPSHEVLGF